MNSFWVDSLTGGDTHSLFVEHFRLRKRVFVDELHWQLTPRGDQEFDQYDTPFASYCLVAHEGKLAAGARILPTNLEMGPNTYMIRDAALGRLGAGLPPTI
jgi:N-acyl-L-homoserine lactone synthetase